VERLLPPAYCVNAVFAVLPHFFSPCSCGCRFSHLCLPATARTRHLCLDICLSYTTTAASYLSFPSAVLPAAVDAYLSSRFCAAAFAVQHAFFRCARTPGSRYAAAPLGFTPGFAAFFCVYCRRLPSRGRDYLPAAASFIPRAPACRYFLAWSRCTFVRVSRAALPRVTTPLLSSSVGTRVVNTFNNAARLHHRYTAFTPRPRTHCANTYHCSAPPPPTHYTHRCTTHLPHTTPHHTLPTHPTHLPHSHTYLPARTYTPRTPTPTPALHTQAPTTTHTPPHLPLHLGWILFVCGIMVVDGCMVGGWLVDSALPAFCLHFTTPLPFRARLPADGIHDHFLPLLRLYFLRGGLPRVCAFALLGGTRLLRPPYTPACRCHTCSTTAAAPLLRRTVSRATVPAHRRAPLPPCLLASHSPVRLPSAFLMHRWTPPPHCHYHAHLLHILTAHALPRLPLPSLPLLPFLPGY